MARMAWLVGVGCWMWQVHVACAADLAALPLLVQDDFTDGAERWKPTDPAAWRIEKDGDNPVYRLHKQSDYRPPHRSPVNISLLHDLYVGDFVFEAKVRSTCRDYDHRDMCLFFGYQDPSHFYYVHLGKRADDHANQIFIVNDAPRVKISQNSTAGTPWTDGWHNVRIERDTDGGAIRVFFDDTNEPAMVAEDKTFAAGRVGLGSFDDTGDWDQVRLRAKRASKPKP